MNIGAKEQFFVLIIACIMLQVSATVPANACDDTPDIDTVTVTMSLSELLQLLQGRDGRDGRDGVPGPKGEPGDVGPQGPPGPAGNTSGGAVYVRWGRTTCPTGCELVYSGRAAKSLYSHSGSGINYQCFPNDPEYGVFEAGTSTERAYIYGVEYESPISALSSSDDQNVPCAVCYVPTRATILMIPAKLTCPTGWTEEYDGYLMAAMYNSASPATYECVDIDAESVPGEERNTNGGQFYHVEVPCNYGLACDSGKEVTCVVCTK